MGRRILSLFVVKRSFMTADPDLFISSRSLYLFMLL